MNEIITSVIVLLSAVTVGAGTVVYIDSISTEAQAISDDRLFQKNFCQSEETLLDDLLYLDGSELSYDSSGCPISSKIIHRWSELSTATQTTLTVRMATNGYEDKGFIAEAVTR